MKDPTLNLVITAIFFEMANAIILPSTSHPKFRHWYEQYRPNFNATLHNNCSAEYEIYLSQHAIPRNQSRAITPVVSCILGHTNSLVNANMQSAGVVLGLLPTCLALAGSSTAETGILALRRPLLAALLGAGSPAVLPIRTFEYRNPADMLQMRPGSRKSVQLGARFTVVASCIQYVLAIGAIYNVAVVSWQLGVWTISSWASQSHDTPIVWAFISIAIHIVGAINVYLRVRLRDDMQSAEPNFWSKVKFHVSQEFLLSSSQSKATLSLRPETDLFLALSWLTSTGIVAHFIFGTFTLSGTLFIGVQDAVVVVARLLVSTLVSRAILMWEMNGMRHVVETESDSDDVLGSVPVTTSRK